MADPRLEENIHYLTLLRASQHICWIRNVLCKRGWWLTQMEGKELSKQERNIENLDSSGKGTRWRYVRISYPWIKILLLKSRLTCDLTVLETEALYELRIRIMRTWESTLSPNQRGTAKIVGELPMKKNTNIDTDSSTPMANKYV